MTTSPSELLQQHPHVELLTLDFFDTLVTRSVAQPTHVFGVMEQELVSRFGSRWRGFARKRVLAEQRAREHSARIDPIRDISFQEILIELEKALDLTRDEVNFVSELEHFTEMQLTVPVAFGRELTREAQLQGLKMLIVSDNYMSSRHLVEVAHAAGYSWVTPDHIVVSCEHAGLKENGALWKQVIAQANVAPVKVLHVGDHAIADGEVPASYGIHTHVNSDMRRVHRDMHNTSPAVIPLSRLEAHIRDQRAGDQWDSALSLGAGLVGLVVASQVVDALRVCEQRDVTAIHFAARDGWLAHQVWNSLREKQPSLPPGSYTAFSRSVVWRSVLTTMTPEIARRFMGDDETVTLERLERRVSCSLRTNVSPSKVLNADEARAILVENATDVVEASRSLKQRVLGYFSRQGLLKDGHHLIIDLGWTGSTLADMADLLRSEMGDRISLEGRLLGLYWDASPNRRRLAMTGFAMDEFHPNDDNLRLLGIIKLLEALVTAPHGSVVDYLDAEHNYEPVLAETAPEVHAYAVLVGDVGKHAIDTALAIVNGTHPSGVTANDITGDALWAAMMQVGHTPRPDEVEALSVIRHVTSIDHEGEGSPIIAQPPKFPRTFPPQQLTGVYDDLIRQHWLQGTVSNWTQRKGASWIPSVMYAKWPFLHPHWMNDSERI